MLVRAVFQKVKSAIADFFDPARPIPLLLVVAVLLTGTLFRVSCTEYEKTKRVDQVTQQKVDTKVDESQKSTQQTQQTTQADEQRQKDAARAVDENKHVVKTRLTVKKPDGTVVTRERETTDYNRSDNSQTHDREDSHAATQTSKTTSQQTDTHAEQHAEQRTETHTVETEARRPVGLGRLGLGFSVSQNLQSAFRGKLDVTPGLTAGARLIGKTRVDLGVDLNGNAWLAGSAGILGIYVGQPLKDVLHGNFHPVPGVSARVPLFGPLSAIAGIDLKGTSFLSLTIGT
jgi:hypothetical protein